MDIFNGHAINDLNGEEIIGTFYEKELQKANQREFRTEKVIKRKGDKLYVNRKGYNLFHNTKITEIEGKIHVTNLATISALTNVEVKIPDVSRLVRKTDCDAKVTEIEKKTY